MNRFARYNGNVWPMDDTDPTTFLNEALVPFYPDLRGARFEESRNEMTGETYFDFSKAAGQKGL